MIEETPPKVLAGVLAVALMSCPWQAWGQVETGSSGPLSVAAADFLGQLRATFDRYYENDTSFEEVLSDDQWVELSAFFDIDVGLVLGHDYYPENDDVPLLGNQLVRGHELRELLPSLIGPLATDTPQCQGGFCIVRAGLHIQSAYYVLRVSEDRFVLAGVFVADDLVVEARRMQIASSQRAWVTEVRNAFGREER